jgi:hypothetical protein
MSLLSLFSVSNTTLIAIIGVLLVINGVLLNALFAKSKQERNTNAYIIVLFHAFNWTVKHLSEQGEIPKEIPDFKKYVEQARLSDESKKVQIPTGLYSQVMPKANEVSEQRQQKKVNQHNVEDIFADIQKANDSNRPTEELSDSDDFFSK